MKYGKLLDFNPSMEVERELVKAVSNDIRRNVRATVKMPIWHVFSVLITARDATLEQ